MLSARTCRAVFVAGLDIDRGLFAQLGQISAHCRFHLAHEVVLLNILFYVFELRNAARNVLNYLEDYEALLGANWLGVLTGLQRKGLILEDFVELTALVLSKIPALCRGRAVTEILASWAKSPPA